MKALLVLGVLATFGIIVLRYVRTRDLRSLVISIGAFVLLIALAIMGNITRPVIPFYLMHLVLVVFAWLGLLYYLFRNRFVWWVVFSPAITIVLYVVWSLIAGSRYEDMWGSLL